MLFDSFGFETAGLDAPEKRNEKRVSRGGGIADRGHTVATTRSQAAARVAATLG